MSINRASELFSSDHREATQKFVAACQVRDAVVEEFPHPLRGPDGEALATHVALLGERDAADIFVTVSGTHGLEGLAGSGCQIALLSQLDSPQRSVAYLFVHMLNPWGAAWGRRQNEENVDLNRNFLSFSAAHRPANEAYSQLHDSLLRPGSQLAGAKRRVEEFIAANGFASYVGTLFRGQYTEPMGIGFGGSRACWSNWLFHSVIARYVRRRKRAVLVDLHSGLGAYGHGTVISTAQFGSGELARLRCWLGADFTSLSAGQHDLPYEVVGDLCSGFREALLETEVTAVALEFGTYDVEQLVALQIEDCLRLNGACDAPADDPDRTREKLRRFFYPSDPLWLASIAARTQDVSNRLLTGLTTCA